MAKLAQSMQKSAKRGGKRRTSGQGRKKGVPNKATALAREAIARFVDGNADRLQEWLDQIANGRPAVRANRKLGIARVKGVEPNPRLAFELYQSLVEYHVPKLARTELIGDQANPLVVAGPDYEKMRAELAAKRVAAQ
jgi:hypothetical protein